jgi:hypothetical protein
VITQVDEALCRLLGRSLPPGTAIRLDPPKPIWHTEAPALAVDLFLFGLYQDPSGPEGARRCRLCYLVTARAARVDEEHALLDHALRTMLFTDVVPAECFTDGFTGGGKPVLLNVANTGAGELWTSLGMPARAAFVLEVSVPILDRNGAGE